MEVTSLSSCARPLLKPDVRMVFGVPVSYVESSGDPYQKQMEHQIDMEYRELALESGIENWGRVPALGLTASITSFGGSNVEIKCRR
ncbi:hypothetical protein HID58_031979 [Brassica napus]|uniref:Uncharacterized protein n=1 Tax=Brassica napus TaxID=3708 RepID=A0ABQ8BV61_BRANA|nr:hypothetical protein HID58_031979 [Brassica napus]